MTAILILLLCVLASSKVVLQSRFGKKAVQTAADAVVFNGMIFLGAGLLYLPALFVSPVGPVTLWYGLAQGFFGVLFQLTYIQALAAGPVSLTILFANFAMIIPLVHSALFYGEPFGVLRVVGTALALTAIALNVNLRHDAALASAGKVFDRRRWAFLMVLTFFFSGLLAILQKLYAKAGVAGENAGYIAVTYLPAALFSLLLYAGFVRAGHKKTFRLTAGVTALSLGIGAILGTFLFFMIRAAASIDGTLLYPAYNGGTMLLVTLSGVLLFRERLTRRQWLSVAVGTAAILLMSLS